MKPYEIITESILAQLDNGVVPWRKPWVALPGTVAQSVAGHVYKGINAFLLGMAPYTDNRWITYKEAIKRGGNVRKGEKGTPIAFWKQFSKENDEGETKTIPFLRYYTVFNVEQCEGLDLPALPIVESNFTAIEQAEAVVAGMPNAPEINHNGGDKAYYTPKTDKISLPSPEAFDSAENYYATTFHELAHSTGHKDRLDRGISDSCIFGNTDYGKEELVAEFTSAFLSQHVGIENTLEISAAYIDHWSQVIKKDRMMIISAASKAQKAADFILGNS